MIQVSLKMDLAGRGFRPDPTLLVRVWNFLKWVWRGFRFKIVDPLGF